MPYEADWNDDNCKTLGMINWLLTARKNADKI